jgi:hypothetical protein
MSQREAIDISFPLLLGRLDVICCNVFLGKQDDSKSLGRPQLRKHDRVGSVCELPHLRSIDETYPFDLEHVFIRCQRLFCFDPIGDLLSDRPSTLVLAIGLQQRVQLLALAVGQDVLTVLDHTRDNLVQGEGRVSPDPVHVPHGLFKSRGIDLAVEQLLALVQKVRVKVGRRVGTLFQNGRGRVGEAELFRHRIDRLVSGSILRQSRSEVLERLETRVKDLAGQAR